MQPVFDYVLKNKEWIFSGIGVLALSAVWWLLSRLPIFKNISAIHAISECVAKGLHRMRIISPNGMQSITYEDITVRGTFLIKPKGDWNLFIQHSDEFWPQGAVLFHPADKTWTGKVWLNSNTSDEATIVLAEITPPIRYLVDHFRRVANEKKTYTGIKMPPRPEGMKIVSQVVISRKSP